MFFIMRVCEIVLNIVEEILSIIFSHIRLSQYFRYFLMVYPIDYATFQLINPHLNLITPFLIQILTFPLLSFKVIIAHRRPISIIQLSKFYLNSLTLLLFLYLLLRYPILLYFLAIIFKLFISWKLSFFSLLFKFLFILLYDLFEIGEIVIIIFCI